MPDGSKPKRFFPIRLKLLSATIVSGLLAVLIALAGLYCMHLLNQRLKEVVDVATEKVKLTNLLRQDLASVTRAERNMFIVTGEKEFDRVVTQMETKLVSIDDHVNKLRMLFIEDENKAQLDSFVESLNQWTQNNKQVRTYSGMDYQRQARELSLKEGETAFNQFEEAINRVVSSIESGITKPADDKTERNKVSGQVPDENAEQELTVQPARERGDVRAMLKSLAELRRDALKLQRVEKNLILQAALDSVQKPDETIAPFLVQVNLRMAVLKELVKEEAGQELVLFVETRLNEYLAINAKIADVVQQKGNSFGFQLFRDTGLPLARSVENIADSMLSQSEHSLDEYERESTSLYNAFRNALLLLSALAVAASVIVSMWIGGKVATNVRQLSGYASEVHRARDLTRPVPKVGSDEIGELADAFEDMRISLLSQNSNLARLNETLEHKNEEMEQFVYSVSHDLKSPLVSCKGLVGLINEDIADEDFNEVRNSARRLSDVTDQMSNTIDDLLTFSRLGRNPLEMEVVDVGNLVNQLHVEWQERLDDANVELKSAADLHPIYGDVMSLRRVFDNLIGNAVKYAGDSENPIIEIGSEKHGRKIRYFVRDNGPGIEPEYHEKIFGLFQRLDTAKKGTGIGLASVAKIIRQHRGRAWVDSKLGSGATFWIELPNTNPQSES